jgi:hypothetical protein
MKKVLILLIDELVPGDHPYRQFVRLMDFSELVRPLHDLENLARIVISRDLIEFNHP